MADKTPLPPTLHLPVEFWGHLVRMLDYKSREIGQLYGYGKVNLTLKIHQGKVTDVFISDSVQLKNMIEKNLTNKE